MFDDSLSGCPEWSITSVHNVASKSMEMDFLSTIWTLRKELSEQARYQNGPEIYWPRPKAPMVIDHVNQNLGTLLSPIWDGYLCLACVYVGEYICLCVYAHVCVFRNQNVVPQVPSIFFLDTRICHWPGTPQAHRASQRAPVSCAVFLINYQQLLNDSSVVPYFLILNQH